MNTQPQPIAPDKITPAELREQFKSLHEDIASLRNELESLRSGLTQAASKPAASSEAYHIFDADTITLSYDEKGKACYKIKGGTFKKFGIRVWDEVLPELGIDPASLKPGPNPINVRVRALMQEITNDATGAVTTQPKKVIGKA